MSEKGAFGDVNHLGGRCVVLMVLSMSIGDVTCVHIGGHPAEGSRKKLSGTGRKKAY